jgi:hypothetical protein
MEEGTAGGRACGFEAQRRVRLGVGDERIESEQEKNVALFFDWAVALSL